MDITIRLLASYRKYMPDGFLAHEGYTQQVPPGTRVSEILVSLPIPATDALTCLVNGRHARLDHELEPGDVLAVFPAVGGG